MNHLFRLIGIADDSVWAAVLRIAATLIIAIVAWTLVNRITKRAIRRRAGQRSRNYFALARYALLALDAFFAVTGILSGSFSDALNKTLAGSGIAAVVLSIACQEPIGNLCSGLIIMLAQPFKVGDLINCRSDNIVGFVEEITMRHTVIRTFENKRVLVPNAIMNKAAVENANYGDESVNFPLNLNVTYESNLKEAIRVAEETIAKRCGKAVTVVVREFEDSCVALRAFVPAVTPSEAIAVKSAILLDLRDRFAESGICFAYPHIEVIQK